MLFRQWRGLVILMVELDPCFAFSGIKANLNRNENEVNIFFPFYGSLILYVE